VNGVGKTVVSASFLGVQLSNVKRLFVNLPTILARLRTDTEGLNVMSIGYVNPTKVLFVIPETNAEAKLGS
jgi:hypothetical protein